MKHILVRSLALIIKPQKKLGQRILIKNHTPKTSKKKNTYLSDLCRKCLQNIKVPASRLKKTLMPQHSFSIHHYYVVGTLFTPQKPFISLLVVNVKLLASLLWVEKKKVAPLLQSSKNHCRVSILQQYQGTKGQARQL